MKTNQLILAAALVVLAACSKESVTPVVNEPSNEIGFNAVASKSTKANDAIISGTTYGSDNSFKVWGWSSAAGTYSELAADAASNFMSNLTISWTKGRDNTRAEAWRNANNYYYWPMTGKISFLAFHPSTVAPTSVSWDATNKKGKATLDDYTIAAGNKTTDLMLAVNEGSRSANALPMVFHHALSQIEVKVKTNDDYSTDVQFDVNSVTFNKIDLSGDMAYANAAFNWSDNEAQTENWLYYDTPMEDISNTAAVYGAANVMIPQAANAQTTITVNYTMTQTGSSPISGEVSVAAPQVWVAGSKYVYTLNFNLNEILFNPSVTDWATVTVDTIDISL